MCRSAQNASSHAMLANANEIKADFTFRRDWGIRTQLEELERRRSGTQRFVKDLTYIGTAEDGVEKFKLVSTNATVVYNTIFTRSERMEGHVKKFIRGIEEKKRELLSSGCTWLDIVLEKELDALQPFLSELDTDQWKNYQARILPLDELPLFQCLVFKEDEEKSAAFVGWFVTGSANSRVFFTDNPANVAYFFDYCEKRFKSKLAKKLIYPAPSSEGRTISERVEEYVNSIYAKKDNSLKG
ncbi:MAG TPA: hypothetical protein VKC60_12620 [Opitutaceae bacterium]|nr:hypothetical protein [Opitutaceae bacterium]